MSRQATCSCGQLTATVEGEPIRISMCHCYNCQRRTGSPFSTQARWPRDAVTIQGERTRRALMGDSGHSTDFEFCPHCGATICFSSQQQPETVAIPVGAFADNTFPPPQYTVYNVRRHPWVSVPEGAESYDD